MCLGNSSTPNDLDFANFISTMSYNHRLYGIFSLPAYIYQTRQLNESVVRIYRDEDIADSVSTNFGVFSKKTILTTRNNTVENINQILLEKMPGEKAVFLSTDTADINNADGLHTIPAEYLQSLDPSGLPPLQLELKVGAAAMLLRNIDPARGLCNGTRLIVVHIGQYLLRARLAHKPDAPIEAISRFTLSSQEGDMPFMLTKRQFPVKLCFAMAFNKLQGQLSYLPYKYLLLSYEITINLYSKKE
ncbi:hypothetical protein RMCBS344292_07482 [Rhizopus microsporus]|nr:hypothetical protein RMCBS344292_07482 [Rhizopus microsporus]